MADYRSKTFGDANMQIQPYYGPPYKYNSTRPDDFRSYSASYASSSSYSYSAAKAAATSGLGEVAPQKLKKVKSTGGSTSSSWSFKDPEFQRKKRIASYKVYAVEGKVKGSFRKSFRLLKDRYRRHGYACYLSPTTLQNLEWSIPALRTHQNPPRAHSPPPSVNSAATPEDPSTLSRKRRRSITPGLEAMITMPGDVAIAEHTDAGPI